MRMYDRLPDRQTYFFTWQNVIESPFIVRHVECLLQATMEFVLADVFALADAPDRRFVLYGHADYTWVFAVTTSTNC